MSQNATDADDACAFEGNPDLYGLGIRLGIYFSVLATLLASHVLPDELSTAWDINGFFLLAVFAAVAKATVECSIHYAEAFVMLQLMFIFLLAVAWTNSTLKWLIRSVAGIMDEREFRFLEKNLSASKVGDSWRNGLATAIACYNVWFWFLFEDPASCNVSVFLFAVAPPQPVIQQIYRVLAVIYLAYRGVRYILSCTNLMISGTRYLRSNERAFEWTWPKPQVVVAFLMDFYYKRGKKGNDETNHALETLKRHQ